MGISVKYSDADPDLFFLDLYYRNNIIKQNTFGSATLATRMEKDEYSSRRRMTMRTGKRTHQREGVGGGRQRQ